MGPKNRDKNVHRIPRSGDTVRVTERLLHNGALLTIDRQCLPATLRDSSMLLTTYIPAATEKSLICITVNTTAAIAAFLATLAPSYMALDLLVKGLRYINVVF